MIKVSSGNTFRPVWKFEEDLARGYPLFDAAKVLPFWRLCKDFRGFRTNLQKTAQLCSILLILVCKKHVVKHIFGHLEPQRTKQKEDLIAFRCRERGISGLLIRKPDTSSWQVPGRQSLCLRGPLPSCGQVHNQRQHRHL